MKEKWTFEVVVEEIKNVKKQDVERFIREALKYCSSSKHYNSYLRNRFKFTVKPKVDRV